MCLSANRVWRWSVVSCELAWLKFSNKTTTCDDCFVTELETESTAMTLGTCMWVLLFICWLFLCDTESGKVNSKTYIFGIGVWWLLNITLRTSLMTSLRDSTSKYYQCDFLPFVFDVLVICFVEERKLSLTLICGLYCLLDCHSSLSSR